jgi:hypothetical protein
MLAESYHVDVENLWRSCGAEVEPWQMHAARGEGLDGLAGLTGQELFRSCPAEVPCCPVMVRDRRRAQVWDRPMPRRYSTASQVFPSRLPMLIIRIQLRMSALMTGP